MLVAGGRTLLAGGRFLMEFTFWDILRNLLLAARWTVLLSLVAFTGGGIVGLGILLARVSSRRWLSRFAELLHRACSRARRC